MQLTFPRVVTAHFTKNHRIHTEPSKQVSPPVASSEFLCPHFCDEMLAHRCLAGQADTYCPARLSCLPAWLGLTSARHTPPTPLPAHLTSHVRRTCPVPLVSPTARFSCTRPSSSSIHLEAANARSGYLLLTSWVRSSGEGPSSQCSACQPGDRCGRVWEPWP